MIKVTRINKHEEFWVNEHQLEFMEATPDTILSMASGRKVAVAESVEEILALIAQSAQQPVKYSAMQYEQVLE